LDGCIYIVQKGPDGPELEDAMGLLDMVGRAGVEMKKVATTKGGEYAGPCPGCGGSDRFRCWPVDREGRGSYWCRQCGKGGDDVQFLVDFLGYEYRDAFLEVGRSMPESYRPANYRPVSDPVQKAFEPKKYDPPVETWRIKAQEFVDKAHAALLENDHAMHYLAGRGIDRQAVIGFRLGWFGGEKGRPCMFRSREGWGLPSMKNEKTGRKKALWIPRGLVIPTFKAGMLYRVRIRRPDEDLKRKEDSRYFVLTGSGMEVSGHNPNHRAFVVVEADLDEMLICKRAGSLVGSVALGSSHVKPGADVFYVLQKALRTLVALDWDSAGKSAWKWWAKNFENARQWPVPDGYGKDPGEAFAKGLDILEWIKAGLPPAMTIDFDHGYKVPIGVPPLTELRMLLEKYPVKIHADEDHAKILYDPGFQNRAIRRRIHDLFFGEDDEVFFYLRYIHPDSIIHGGNCLPPAAVAAAMVV
jgi:DNA primase